MLTEAARRSGQRVWRAYVAALAVPGSVTSVMAPDWLVHWLVRRGSRLGSCYGRLFKGFQPYYIRLYAYSTRAHEPTWLRSGARPLRECESLALRVVCTGKYPSQPAEFECSTGPRAPLIKSVMWSTSSHPPLARSYPLFRSLFYLLYL